MMKEALHALLAQVAAGQVDPDQALERLRALPYDDLGFARVDHHRSLRLGFPEVVFGAGKTVEQLRGILTSLMGSGDSLLVTRVSADAAATLVAEFGPLGLEHAREARCLIRRALPTKRVGRGPLAVVAAGTSDLFVAEEAAVTAELMGNEVVRIYDVGVAGLHRLLAVRERLEAARVLVVVAGMEGALPSVLGGLIARPIIAVPTSVGYGASFQGLAALLAMLNSCAAGVTVVNIDNGFGAGYAASLINRRDDATPGLMEPHARQ